MRTDHMNDSTNAAATAAPARCPECYSQDLTTTSKVVNAETYWRCCKCGEVWNAGRHRPPSRYASDTPWRR